MPDPAPSTERPPHCLVRGECCSLCGAPAAHKVGEEIPWDDPDPCRHNLTACVCCAHFRLIMGPAVRCGELTPTKAARTTAYLLGEYATLLNRDGLDSAEARALIDAHRDNREFVELAETSRRLKAALSGEVDRP